MKSNFIRLIFIIVVFAYSGIATAQTIEVSGLIKDADSGMPIPGVTVMEKGTSNGTVTNGSGNFTLKVMDPNGILHVSFIGYATQEFNIEGRSTINIVLSFESNLLDEIVVIGYGSQKKKVVTGAIATVNADEIKSTPTLRIDQAMQGRTAGVQVTNLSGQPGEEPTVLIRGAGTTGDATPLYVVDGMVVGGIDYLNPGDIKSIDVLKDAASAAIYGARAANGVILITTKSGENGQSSVTYSGYQGIQNVSKMLDMLDAEQYMMIMNEGARNANRTEPFDAAEIPQFNTNWQKELFETNAPIINHELSFTGGSEKTSYSSSFSYFSQEGIIGGDKSKFDRLTGRINVTNNVNKWLKFGSNMAFSHINRRGIGSNTSFNGAYSSALNLDPLTPVYQDDEVILNDPLGVYYPNPAVTNADGRVYAISDYFSGGEIVNPLALLETQTGVTRVDKYVGSVFSELEIIKGLKLRTSAGVDLAYVLNDSYRPLYYLNGAQLNIDKTSVSKSIDRYFTWQWDNTLNYSKQIGEHNFSALIGMSADKFQYENLSGFNTMVPTLDPDNVYLSMATDTMWTANGGASHEAHLSQFARVTYDYMSRYAFTGIIRRDGSSNFGPNNRFGIFPSLGVSWIISEEDFMPDLGPIGIIKLRGSWGLNGNDRIGRFQYISVMDYSRGYIFGGGRVVGASPQYIENESIHWEESEQIDVAMDFGAFNNRLTGTVDYYIKNTRGLLERISIPGHIGNDAPYANVGSVENKGIEMSVNWRNSNVATNFSYSIGLNASYNKNEMTHIENESKVIAGASWAVAGMVTRSEEGFPIAYFYGYETDGIFQSLGDVYAHIGSTGEVLQPNAVPGDVIFVDVNKDGVLNEDDRTMIGNPTPDWTFGMNGSISYNGFDCSLLLVGTYGNDIFNGSQRPDLGYTNRTTAILDRWTPENPSNTVPRYTWSDVNNNNRVSDLYVEDGSFLRVKNIQIGYTFSSKILSKIKAKNLRLYVSAENLFTFTKYTGADPEIGAMSSFDVGIDRGIYPQARTFRLGTTMTF